MTHHHHHGDDAGELAADVRHLQAEVSSLRAELAETQRERDNARALVSSLRALLAVIYRFVILPLPVKDEWQDYYLQGMKRLDRLRHMANELQGANVTAAAVDQWAQIIARHHADGYGYQATADVGAKTAAPGPAGLASCGHPANEDGECDCSSWPERAPGAAAAGQPSFAAVPRLTRVKVQRPGAAAAGQ